MRYQVNMSGKHITRNGKKIFNDINEIPMYLYEVIRESLFHMEGVCGAKEKIFNSFHITPFEENMNSLFKATKIEKTKIEISDKYDEPREIDRKATNLAQDETK